MAHDEDCRKTREIQILTREVADLKADAERDFIAHVQIVEALKSRAADALARAERAEKEAEGFAADAATQHDLLAASEARARALEGALKSISIWREECHNHDQDMGHPPRFFDAETVEQIEAFAEAALSSPPPTKQDAP